MTTQTQTKTPDEMRTMVRERYGEVARSKEPSCCSPSCCSAAPAESRDLGYSEEELNAVPEGANMGLGCGNPQAIAALRPGETVLDLGAGGGFDCFLAARQVGEEGKVIGVDMTADMVSKARANAQKAGTSNVEFRLGEIEHLPVSDSSVDVILSNCVINLSPDKAQVFRDAYRVLKPGGRLAISDIVQTAPLPSELADAAEAFTGCMAGAAQVDEVKAMLNEAGFKDVRVTPKQESRDFIKNWLPATGVENYVTSANIEARKPNA